MPEDDGWEYSTEGDRDPDLTEEAGYSGWEPTRRLWTSTFVFRLVTATILASFLFGIVVRLL